MHFAEAALGVEGGVVEVVALEVEGGHDVIADEFEPGDLCGLEGLTGVLAENPVAVVTANGVGEGGELFVDAAGAADEGDKGSEFADRGGLGIESVKGGVGLPDLERGEVRGLGFQVIEDFRDLGKGDFLTALGLVVVNGEGGQFVLVVAEVGLEVLLVLRGGGCCRVPACAEEDVDGVGIDGLEVFLTGLDNVGDEGAGKRDFGFGDE